LHIIAGNRRAAIVGDIPAEQNLRGAPGDDARDGCGRRVGREERLPDLGVSGRDKAKISQCKESCERKFCAELVKLSSVRGEGGDLFLLTNYE